MFDDSTIFVTGGTGSFGKKVIDTILKEYNPAKIIVYSRDELKQFEMENSPLFSPYNDKISYILGDVRDQQRLRMAIEGVDFVIHTAALKQVPRAEYNPFEAVKTNIIGAQNVIETSIQSGVQKVIGLSTDKAAAPINLYGATKLTSDKLFAAANEYQSKDKTKFSVVRYGNVMGSRGSLIPFFLIKKKDGVLPVTDSKMTRFNITLEQGVDFVISCFKKMWGGELFVPKIPSYRILDVAEAIDADCKIEIIGIRPGEKIHEEMITLADSLNTIEFDEYYVILPSTHQWDTDRFRLESNDKPGTFCEEEFSYNSGTNDNFLTIEQLKIMIQDVIDSQ